VEGNFLTTLPEEIFSELTSLKSLHLDDNQIDVLPEKIFSGLGSLGRLHLNNNKLTTLHPRIFSGMKALELLYLSYNKLTSLDPDIFSENRELREINISNNYLSVIPHRPPMCMNFSCSPSIKDFCYESIFRKIDDEVCSISYEPIKDGDKYRMCSNPIKSHYYTFSSWDDWATVSGNDRCVLCRIHSIIPNIFVNKTFV
jgi:Leucine-rich repeat (LRR) protein